ncbi:MAG: YaaR family protein [Eubacteriales bacterium]
MEIKVDQIQPVVQTEQAGAKTSEEGTFKYMLTSNIAESELQAKMTALIEEITMQGNRLSKRMDVRDMKRYRSLVKEFMNEVVTHSHEFSRENFLDRRGRHRVYGIVKLVDEALDALAQELVQEEKDHLNILNKIGEIRGLLLDIFT